MEVQKLNDLTTKGLLIAVCGTAGSGKTWAVKSLLKSFPSSGGLRKQNGRFPVLIHMPEFSKQTVNGIEGWSETRQYHRSTPRCLFRPVD